MNCYCCSNKARESVFLLQGWTPVCRNHAKEAQSEEPGIPVCEIEELELLESERKQSIVA